jgi:hypothetical protein
VDKVGVIGGNFWDIPVTLPMPCNTFFIGSIRGGDEANSICISFVPTNRPRGFAFPGDGTEKMFNMKMNSNIAGPGPNYYGLLRFGVSVQNVFFSIGSENGNLSRYSIGCCNDIGDDKKGFRIRGGLYF